MEGIGNDKLSKVYGQISSSKKYFNILSETHILTVDEVSSSFSFLMNEEDGIASLSKSQIICLLINFKKFTEIFSPALLEKIVEKRYRRYIFWILYILWQDNYDDILIINLMIKALDRPKTSKFIEETSFTIEELLALVKAVDKEVFIAREAEKKGVSVREYLLGRSISLDSYLGLTALRIQVLYWTSDQYLRLGSDKLLWLLGSMDEKNISRIIENIFVDPSDQGNPVLKDVAQFLFLKYGFPSSGHHDVFWDFLTEETRHNITSL